MILKELGPVTAYRMHAPRWAAAPTSGAGAAARGGRTNRPGTPGLYLALEPETAVREYQQLSPLMPPGTLVSYTVRPAPVVDYRAGYDSTRWSALWEEFHCNWRELWFNQRVEPPSWVLAGETLAAGAKGILFVSTLAQGGTNLVVFNDMLSTDDMLQVYDPTGALPKIQTPGADARLRSRSSADSRSWIAVKPNDAVNKLVLYAPLWLVRDAPPISGAGAYRSVTKEAARQRGARGIPAARVEEIWPTPWFDKKSLARSRRKARRSPPSALCPLGL